MIDIGFNALSLNGISGLYISEILIQKNCLAELCYNTVLIKDLFSLPLALQELPILHPLAVVFSLDFVWILPCQFSFVCQRSFRVKREPIFVPLRFYFVAARHRPFRIRSLACPEDSRGALVFAH